MYALPIVLALLAARISVTMAANCYQDKPFKNNEPADAISSYLRSSIGSICNNGNPIFGSDKLDNTWSNSHINLRIRREQESTDLSECYNAFNDILEQCISGKLWGGEYDWTASKYTIENTVYDSGQSPLGASQFMTWVHQEVDSYKGSEDDDHKKAAAAAAAAAASFIGSVGGSAAAVAALTSAANAQAAAAMEQAVSEADKELNQQNPSSAIAPSSSPTSASSSAAPSATHDFRLACSPSQYQWPPSTTEFETKNDKGTNFHVDSGCGLLNGNPRCAESEKLPFEASYHIDDQGKWLSHASLYWGFDSTKTSDENTTPSCKIDALWPRGYEDVYWRDNCLRDSSGNVIYGQCCGDNTKNSDSVQNPYHQQQSTDSGIKKEDCQAMVDDKSIFPDHESNVHPTWSIQVGTTTDAKDNGKSWYKTLASHGTCELQLVLWSNPQSSVLYSIDKDVPKAWVQKAINDNTLPRQNWVRGKDQFLIQLLALVPTGNAPWDYSESSFGVPDGGRDKPCNAIDGPC